MPKLPFPPPPYFSYKCTTKKPEVSKIDPSQSHSLILTHSMPIGNNRTEFTINRVRSEAGYTMRSNKISRDKKKMLRAFQGGLMDRARSGRRSTP